MRPIAEVEEQLNQKRRFDNPNLTYLYRLAATTDLTEFILAELFFSVEEEQHIVCPITGKTGTSKTTIMKKLASMSRRLKWNMKNVNAEFILTWSPIQSQAKAQLGKLQKWADLGQDEFRRGRVGKGSATSEQGFITMTETLRAEQNSFFTCSPKKPNLDAHFTIRARGYMKGDCIIKGRGQLRNVSMAIVKGPEFNLPMGTIFLDEASWPIDPYVEGTYTQTKRSFNALVKKYGGNIPEISSEVLEYVEAQFMEHLEEHHPDDMLELTKTELERVYMVEARLPTVFYMDNLVTSVAARLRRKKRVHDTKLKAERIEKEEQNAEEQWKLVREMIAPKMVDHFMKESDEQMIPPKRAVLRDYLRTLNVLHERFFIRCMDRFEHLWHQQKAKASAVDNAREKVTRPPPLSPKDFNTDPSFWLAQVKERNPKLMPSSHDYWGAYKSYLEKEKDFESQRKAADFLGISRRTLRDHFESIAGAIKSLMGYEFERVMALLYQSDDFKKAGVLRIDPPGDEVARKSHPDRIAYLQDGQILVCSWKCHSKNENIRVKDSPEWRMTEELQKQGQDAIMVLEGLFGDRFFSKKVPMNLKTDSIRIRENDFMKWPPNPKEVFGRPAQNRRTHLEFPPAPSGKRERVLEGGKNGVSRPAQGDPRRRTE